MNDESQPPRHAAVAGGAAENVCPRCGGRFTCGMAAGATGCWCAGLPPATIDRDVAACLCPACLAAAVKRPRAGPA